MVLKGGTLTPGRRRDTVRTVAFVCVVCGASVVRPLRLRGEQTCCSRSCAARRGNQLKRERGQTARMPVVCANCGQTFLKWRNDVPRSVLHFCRRACKTAYVRSRVESVTLLNGRLRDAVWDRDGGRCTDCGSVRFTEVHHRNGDHSDNRMDNLALLCKRCHVRQHVLLRGGMNSNGTRARLSG